jgi:hypothetical protein
MYTSFSSAIAHLPNAILLTQLWDSTIHDEVEVQVCQEDSDFSLTIGREYEDLLPSLDAVSNVLAEKFGNAYKYADWSPLQ